MHIQLDEKYRLSGDQYQWILQRKSRQKNDDGEWEERWKAESYYTDLGKLITEYAERRLRLSDATNIHEALQEVASIGKSLRHALQPSYRVVDNS